MEILKNIWEAILSRLPGAGEAAAEASADASGEAEEAVQSSSWVETFRTIIYAVLIAVGVRTVAYEPFNIPSESMLPTLLVGDYLFVSKFSYGYSKHSLPFSPPLFSGRIFESPVERGDVAVFKLPKDNSTDYIKRIIGVPGDKIQMRNGTLFLNGQPVKRVKVKDFIHKKPGGNPHAIPTFRETLPNGVTYRTLDYGHFPADNTRVFEVPEGYYFAMGDNRDNSVDSRFRDGVGMVPAQNLVGRADVLFFSTNGEGAWWQIWKWPWIMRYSRFFTGIE